MLGPPKLKSGRRQIGSTIPTLNSQSNSTKQNRPQKNTTEMPNRHNYFQNSKLNSDHKLPTTQHKTDHKLQNCPGSIQALLVSALIADHKKAQLKCQKRTTILKTKSIIPTTNSQPHSTKPKSTTVLKTKSTIPTANSQSHSTQKAQLKRKKSTTEIPKTRICIRFTKFRA